MSSEPRPAAARPEGAGEAAAGERPGGPTLVATDRVFEAPASAAADFMFGREVASVFDDMVGRSVPFYAEIQRMTCEMTADFAQPGTRIYDYGCGTGTTLAALDAVVPEGVAFVGVDDSENMLAKAREKLRPVEQHRRVDLLRTDMHVDTPADNASVALMLLTLQFLRPLHREHIVAQIHRGLVDNGCFILVEKVLGEHGLLNRQFIKYYYEMKRRHGYSDAEIARKREALENVLVPYRADENMDLLRRVGFTQIEVFFRWYNFCGIVAVK